MNWKQVFNPWGEISRLREEVAYLEGKCETWERLAEEAEARAFHHAADHYWQRNRMIEEAQKVMQEKMMDIANATPLSFIATMQGTHFKAP